MNATSNAIADSGFGLVGDFLARAGSGRLLAGFVAGAFLYLALGWLYNVTLHPLRGFPGPKLAAASHLYEFYYDVLLGGRFMWAIQRMHEKYGVYDVAFLLVTPVSSFATQSVGLGSTTRDTPHSARAATGLGTPVTGSSPVRVRPCTNHSATGALYYYPTYSN